MSMFAFLFVFAFACVLALVSPSYSHAESYCFSHSYSSIQFEQIFVFAFAYSFLSTLVSPILRQIPKTYIAPCSPGFHLRKRPGRTHRSRLSIVFYIPRGMPIDTYCYTHSLAFLHVFILCTCTFIFRYVCTYVYLYIYVCMYV